MIGATNSARMHPSSIHSDLFFFRRQLAPYRRQLILAGLLLLAESCVALSMPWFAGRVAQDLLAGRIPDALLLAWLGVLGVQCAIAFADVVMLGGISMRITADLGSNVYDHLQALPLRWHQDRQRGEVLALLGNDVARISTFMIGTLIPLLPMFFTFIGALILLLRIDVRIGLAVAAGVPLFVLALRLLTRQLRPLADASIREDALKTAIAEQNLATLPIIKAYTREAEESARFAVQSHKVRELDVRLLRRSALLSPMVRWIASAAVLLLLWLGGREVAAGSLRASELVSLLLYGLLLTQPVSQLASVYGQVQSARGSARRLIEVLDEPVEADAGGRELTTVRGELSLQSIGYAYPGRAPIFEALDLHVLAGETVAITGRNGVGKSTLIHLLMRFADPQSGRITLDNIDLRELSLRNLRSHIGLVTQHVLLFNASVAHNIGYGRFRADQDQIERAAGAARAHEFIVRLPQGYDTVIGDNGVRLSGGQKQRIALARALLKDPAILILDEATAMFDPEGERDFIAECHELLHSRTVLLITHRPASLALADRVLRMENGRLRQVDRP